VLHETISIFHKYFRHLSPAVPLCLRAGCAGAHSHPLSRKYRPSCYGYITRAHIFAYPLPQAFSDTNEYAYVEPYPIANCIA